ncbi:hypothetical protein, partial [Klebsiella pneumoniae]|uniref:hypothetical protein n=1 Tax=Klebsiella pneumoniae TaxID=573 RepID=UPI0013307DEF
EDLYARMKAGEGKTLIQSSPGGKTFMFQVTASVEEYFEAYAAAIGELSDDDSAKIVATYADFSCLQR